MIIQHPTRTRVAADVMRRNPRELRKSPLPHVGGYGFTLMEVLLALTVCALVLVVMNGVFFNALQLRSRTLGNLDESLPIERALDFLRRDLENAVPAGGPLSGPLLSDAVGSGMTGQGGIQIYTATGLLSANSPWGDIQKVTYQLRSPANASTPGYDLVRSVTRNLLPASTEEIDDQWLASGIESLTFSYFDGANWASAWDATLQTNLPLAVRVSVLPVAYAKAQSPRPFELLVLPANRGHSEALAAEEEEEPDEN